MPLENNPSVQLPDIATPDLMQSLSSFPTLPDVGFLGRRNPRPFLLGHKHRPHFLDGVASTYRMRATYQDLRGCTVGQRKAGSEAMGC